MKLPFWIGLVILLLGIASILIAIPRQEHDGVRVVGLAVGLDTRHDETVLSIVSAVMVLGGAGLMISGRGQR